MVKVAMTIILDLDDVLANLRESLCQTLGRAAGSRLHWRDWRHYDLRQHYPTVADRLEPLLIAARTLELCQPEPGAAAATQALDRLGFTVLIITARGWHPQGEALTRAWLNEHGIHYDELAVVPLGTNKLAALSPMHVVALAVDDHPSHVMQYRQAGIPALLMDRPWNAGLPGERIDSLDTLVARAGAIRRDRR